MSKIKLSTLPLLLTDLGKSILFHHKLDNEIVQGKVVPNHNYKEFGTDVVVQHKDYVPRVIYNPKDIQWHIEIDISKFTDTYAGLPDSGMEILFLLRTQELCKGIVGEVNKVISIADNKIIVFVPDDWKETNKVYTIHDVVSWIEIET